MGTGLHDWAATGDYSEEPEPRPSPARKRRFRHRWRLEDAPAAVLVPIGIFMGSLMALACVARLLMLPLEMAGDSRDDTETEPHPWDCC